MKRFLVVLLAAVVFVPSAGAVNRADATRAVNSYEARVGGPWSGPAYFPWTIDWCYHQSPYVICSVSRSNVTVPNADPPDGWDELVWDCVNRRGRVTRDYISSGCMSAEEDLSARLGL